MSTITPPDPATTDWVPLWSLGEQTRQRTAVRVTRSTPQAIPTGAATAVAFDSARYDIGGPHWSGGAPTRLTCKVAGTYGISGQITLHNSNGGAFRLLFITVNGTRVADAGISLNNNLSPSAFGADPRISINTQVSLQ